MNIDRMIADARDRLAEADDTNRVGRLNDLATAYEAHADTGCVDCPELAFDSLTATLIRGIAGADLAATGQLSRLHHRADDRYAPVLQRMATEPNITARARLLQDLCHLIGDESAAEAIACLPYAPGMVGWRTAEYLTGDRSVRGFVKALGWAWRNRRAV